jgi:hypothetical protein
MLTPLGNLYQNYIWSELINNSFFTQAEMIMRCKKKIGNHFIK